jgi:DNA-binding NtrC family response regulator
LTKDLFCVIIEKTGSSMANTLSALLVQHSESASPRIATALRAAGLVADAEQVESEGQVRAALERRSWDVIIAEECRPRFDALAALLLVRGMGLQTPFLVVADTIGEDNVAELMRRGANDCLAGDWVSRLGPVVQREVAAAAARLASTGQAPASSAQAATDAQNGLAEARELTGSAGHDLNNLLQVVQGYGQLALDVLPPAAEARPHLDEVLRAVEKARKVVLRLLLFSRQGSPPATAGRETPRNAAPPRPFGPPGGSESILLAEDDESVRGFALRVLQRAGYKVHTVQDGEEAMRWFRACGADVRLAIVDAVLPRMGGKALADRIHELSPRLPVLISTGYAYRLQQEGFVPSATTEVINKPFTHVELLRSVRGLIDSVREV